MLNCRLGLSTNSKEINEELFKNYADAGIESMEISVDYDECSALNFDKIKALSDKYGVELWSFHFPFSPFDIIDISNPELCDFSVDLFKGYIDKANAIGIKVFVVHSGGEPIEDVERKLRMKTAKESLKRLAEYAETVNCTIAVENLPRSCLGNSSSDISELISAHDSLRVCFDTNHLLGQDNINFINDLGKKIITTHISDYDFINERHWMPGEGKNDWQKLTDALEKVGYSGPWLYEIGFQAPWSMERNRDLNCNDFKNNFLQIINHQAIDKIGTPKSNLGMWSVLE